MGSRASLCFFSQHQTRWLLSGEGSFRWLFSAKISSHHEPQLLPRLSPNKQATEPAAFLEIIEIERPITSIKRYEITENGKKNRHCSRNKTKGAEGCFVLGMSLGLNRNREGACSDKQKGLFCPACFPTYLTRGCQGNSV